MTSTLLWVRAIVIGLFAGISSLAVLTSTSGELEPLVAWNIATGLQIPALILIGFLTGLAVTDLARSAAAYGVNCVSSSLLHVVLYAVPGLELANYTVSRFNNGFTTSFFVLMMVAVFGLIGQGAALAVNVYVRGILDN